MNRGLIQKLGTGVAVALLAGCGASQPPIGAPGLTSQGHAIAQHAARGKSWMLPSSTNHSWFLPDSRKTSLLYATDGNSDVLVYSFPKGRLVGTLTGFGQAAGLCTDSQQDVFITDSAFHEVVEYAHGGTTPIATITEQSGNYPIACSVDPHTNNLAVANELPGDVAVFQNAQGSPKIFGYNQADFWGCAFDDGSNYTLAVTQTILSWSF